MCDGPGVGSEVLDFFFDLSTVSVFLHFFVRTFALVSLLELLPFSSLFFGAFDLFCSFSCSLIKFVILSSVIAFPDTILLIVLRGFLVISDFTRLRSFSLF